MRIGKLRERVLVQQYIEQDDNVGGDIGTFEDLCSIWAQVTTKSNDESIIGGSIQSQNTYTFRIRRRDDIKASMRLIWQGRTLNIVSIQPDFPGFMVLQCQDISDGGNPDES